MRPAVAVIIFLVIVFLGGALLAPLLYQIVQSASAGKASWEGIARQPFHRYVTRAMIIIALLGLYPFLRAIGTPGWKNIGWGWTPTSRREFGLGLVFGFASLAVVAVVSVLAGGRGLHAGHTAVETFKHVRNALLAALIVSPIEETIFRGAIFGGLKKSLKWTTALVISSAIYAIVHFFQRTGSPAEIHWYSGLVVLADMSRGFVDLHQLIPAFFNLFVAGVILAEAFQRTNALFFSMGLHAGWIFWLKTYGFLTTDRPGVSAVFWGSGKLIDGWFSTILLCGVLVAVRRYVLGRERDES